MSSPEPRLSKLILVVLYRISPAAASSLIALRSADEALHADDSVLVWDNSPEPASDAAFAAISAGSPAHWIYRHTPENRSLSSIYNESTRVVPGKHFLVIFDHDSSFGPDYFRALDAAAAEAPQIDLFVPLVRVEDKIVSPGHFRYFKGSLWRTPAFGVRPSKSTVVIGSGMAIRSRFLQSFGGFDERLKLYGVDSNFMLRYAKKRPSFFVMDVRFDHDMEAYHHHDAATLRRRFDAFEYASRINAELLPWPARVLSALFLRYKKFRLPSGSGDGQNGDT